MEEPNTLDVGEKLATLHQGMLRLSPYELGTLITLLVFVLVLTTWILHFACQASWKRDLRRAQYLGKYRQLDDLKVDVRDGCPVCGGDGVDCGHKVKPKKISKIVIKFTQMAKAKFGCPVRNHSNYLAIRRFVERSMNEENVRYVDQMELIPQVIYHTMIPSDDEIYWSRQFDEEDSKLRERALLRLSIK
jgi:hypothetical protein